jgi:alpha-L-arabinofuranosidase
VLDAVATRSADGRTISLKIVNTDLERTVHTRINVQGARVGASATLERIIAGSLAATNGFKTPNAVRTTRESVNVRNGFVLDLPRHSISVLTLTLAR